MADGTDAADARHQRGHLVKWAALAQFLEAAKLCYVEACVFHTPVFVQMKRDLGMAFDTRQRIDDDSALLLHDVSLASFELRALSCELRIAGFPFFSATLFRSLAFLRFGSKII